MKVLILLSLVASIAAQNMDANNIPGKECGGVVCLNRTDVTCLPQANLCRCAEGQVGNGRFVCVDASQSCVCYLYGDPYVTAFSQSVMSAPLPCRHVLTEFTTPDGTYVKVSALASTRDERNYPGYVFEDRLIIQISKGTTTAYVDIRRDGFFVKDLVIPLPASRNFPTFGIDCSEDDSNHFHFQVVGRGVHIRYRSGDSSVTIQAPKDSQYVGSRLCGDCADDQRTYRRESEAGNLSLPEFSFLKTLQNLDTENEEDAVCQALGTNYNNCADSKQAEAAYICGLPFSHNDIGECFVKVMGKPATLKMTADCIKSYCNGDKTAFCSKVPLAQAVCPDVDFSRFGCVPSLATMPPYPMYAKK